MKKYIVVFLMFGSFLYAQKSVTVSIVPQKYFVQKIAKDKIDVNVMVRPGFSPATYEPKTSQMKELANSEIYFSIGVPFENSWLERFENSNKNMLIVDTSNGINKLEMAEHSHAKEEHDDHHEEKHHEEKHHDHEHHEKKHDDHEHDAIEKEEHHKEAKDDHDNHNLDPHIWLDPILVKAQAKNILNGLIKIDKENKSFYEKNYNSFINELDTLHKDLVIILNEVKNKEFMVFHPSWGYFAKRYSLEQKAVEKEGKDPKPKELRTLISEAKEHNIKIVFVAPQFSQKSAKIIASSIGGRVSIIDPLKEEWKENLIYTAKEIVKSYK